MNSTYRFSGANLGGPESPSASIEVVGKIDACVYACEWPPE